MKKKRHYLYLALVFGFILGVHKGNLALWRDTETEPVRVFPYQVRFLPEADQKALAEGIHITSPDALVQLLEDFLS